MKLCQFLGLLGASRCWIPRHADFLQAATSATSARRKIGLLSRRRVSQAEPKHCVCGWPCAYADRQTLYSSPDWRQEGTAN